MLTTLSGCGSAVSGLAVRGPVSMGTAIAGSATPSPAGAVNTPIETTPTVGATISSTPSPSRMTGASSLTQDEFVAKLVGGDPASNMLWMLPIVPADWTPIPGSGAGARAWQLPGSRCRVILQQPDGMSGGSVVGSATLAADASSRLATANGSTSPQVVAKTPVTFTVANVAGPVSVEFAGQQTHFADLGVTSLVWAYLSGDYALLAENVCPDGDMARWKASAGQFYRELKVRIEF